jgi:hypothetical protein
MLDKQKFFNLKKKYITGNSPNATDKQTSGSTLPCWQVCKQPKHQPLALYFTDHKNRFCGEICKVGEEHFKWGNIYSSGTSFVM